MIPIVFLFCCIILSSTSIDYLQQYSVEFRFGGIFLISLLALLRKKPTTNSLFKIKLLPDLWATIIISYFFIMGIIHLYHGDPEGFAIQMGALLALSVLWRFITQRFTPDKILTGVTVGLHLIAIISCIMIALIPTYALEHGRLRGVSESANFFGALCALGVFVSFNMIRRVGLSWLSTIFFMCLTIYSGSRASLLLVFVSLFVLSLFKNSKSRIFLSTAALVLAVIFLYSDGLKNFEIFRSNNSRIMNFEGARNSFATAPFFGQGAPDALAFTGIAGSPFDILIQGGIFSFLILCIVYLVILLTSWRIGYRTFSLSVGVLVHSFFESWMISLSGPMALMFALVWLAVAESESIGVASKFSQVASP